MSFRQTPHIWAIGSGEIWGFLQPIQKIRHYSSFLLGLHWWIFMSAVLDFSVPVRLPSPHLRVSVYKQDQESMPLKLCYLSACCWAVQSVSFLICWWKCTEVEKKTPSWSRVCYFFSPVQDTCHCLPLLLVAPAWLGPGLNCGSLWHKKMD